MKKVNKIIVPSVVGLAAFAGLAGGLALNAIGASAETSTDTAVASSSTSPAQKDPSQGGHVGSNGVKEELLTGETATKAKAAAEAAVPGGTILRVENDAEGATYEAHVKKSDGSQVTVKMDASFKVTSIDTGPGPRPNSN